MPDFKYAPMFQLGKDTTEYYKIPGSENPLNYIKHMFLDIQAPRLSF